MECGYHAGVEAITQCRACQLGLCATCAEQKPTPDLGFLFNMLVRMRWGLHPGERLPTYFCRQTCQAYERTLRGLQSRGKLLRGIVYVQFAVLGVCLLAGGLVLVAGVLLALTHP